MRCSAKGVCFWLLEMGVLMRRLCFSPPVTELLCFGSGASSRQFFSGCTRGMAHSIAKIIHGTSKLWAHIMLFARSPGRVVVAIAFLCFLDRWLYLEVDGKS